MMKKNGFTLAEVLITLTIIGVVAMMTLPALMTNVAEQQAKTGIKKAINTLTEAAQMSEAISGFNFGSLKKDLTSIDANSPDTQTMTGLLMSRTAVDVGKSRLAGGDLSVSAKYMIDDDHGSTIAKNNFNNANIVFLRDGSALLYNPDDTFTSEENSETLEDGLPLGFTILYDINGTKGPNMLSNCNKETDPEKDGSFTYPLSSAQINTGIDVDACIGANKSNRMIKDQFLLQVRRNVVQPASPAALWAATD